MIMGPMSTGSDNTGSAGTVLLCFDGSEDAEAAIAKAGQVLATKSAVVLTVWEPVAVWEPYDPGAIVGAGIGKLASHALGLDEIARDIAREQLERGVELARSAGFETRAELAGGKAWAAICDAAAKLDAEVIVVGARGLSRVQSLLLGSVSAAVVVHAKRPVMVVSRPS